MEKVLATFRPQLVGLSAMTFQYDTLLRVARVVRRQHRMAIFAGGTGVKQIALYFYYLLISKKDPRQLNI